MRNSELSEERNWSKYFEDWLQRLWEDNKGYVYISKGRSKSLDIRTRANEVITVSVYELPDEEQFYCYLDLCKEQIERIIKTKELSNRYVSNLHYGEGELFTDEQTKGEHLELLYLMATDVRYYKIITRNEDVSWITEIDFTELNKVIKAFSEVNHPDIADFNERLWVLKPR